MSNGETRRCCPVAIPLAGSHNKKTGTDPTEKVSLDGLHLTRSLLAKWNYSELIRLPANTESETIVTVVITV